MTTLPDALPTYENLPRWATKTDLGYEVAYPPRNGEIIVRTYIRQANTEFAPAEGCYIKVDAGLEDVFYTEVRETSTPEPPPAPVVKEPIVDDFAILFPELAAAAAAV